MHIDILIINLGFTERPIEVKGRLSISDLFHKSHQRCGIYLLRFNNETYYIGQAIDIVRRFSQHCKNYSNIEDLWFQPVKQQELNKVEQELIALAESEGMLLTNKTYTSNIIGDTDLDLLIPENDQQNWLLNNYNIETDIDLYYTIPEKYKIKYQSNFIKLKKLQIYPQLKRLLKIYLSNCIPCYKKTEMSFWSLSCLPNTNKNSSPRYICLNVNFMEVFVIGFDKKTEEPFSFLNGSGGILDSQKTIDYLYSKYRSIDFEVSNYKAAGFDQMRIYFDDLIELEEAISKETAIIQSIKELNLRLMRKGGTIFSPYHCFDLVHGLEVIE